MTYLHPDGKKFSYMFQLAPHLTPRERVLGFYLEARNAIRAEVHDYEVSKLELVPKDDL